jgi:hypothetical protein
MCVFGEHFFFPVEEETQKDRKNHNLEAAQEKSGISRFFLWFPALMLFVGLSLVIEFLFPASSPKILSFLFFLLETDREYTLTLTYPAFPVTSCYATVDLRDESVRNKNKSDLIDEREIQEKTMEVAKRHSPVSDPETSLFFGS